MAQNEIWLPVPNYNGLYEVSNFGNVRGLQRDVVNSKGVKFTIKPKELKKGCAGTKNRYKRVVLCKNSKIERWFIHRLVAMAFIPNPDNKPQVNHIDNNQSNNRVENLEWCTHKENMQHEVKNGRTQQGVKNKGVKLTEQQVLKIRELRKTMRNIDIANMYNVDRNAITAICTGKTWKHLK